MTAPPRRRSQRLRREAWGFAVGSLFFAIGAVPGYAQAVGPTGGALTFVIGSVFFTAAAFIQLALSGRRPPEKALHGAPAADWWSAATQFVGTILFNISTTAVLVAAATGTVDPAAGWRPDAGGSVLFLVSSALALVAAARRHELWDPLARTWHGTWLNAAGSVFFAVSAVGAFVVPSTRTLLDAHAADAGTLLGALCFLAAALLSRRAISVDGE
ncbi:hypothetical protein ABXJ56_13535 [Microbacterium chocolatum]|uniref:hypothetical protein n=1 Tax=Microbacterium aurantiacum TaxID=162393 RepID=UPI00338F1AF0